MRKTIPFLLVLVMLSATAFAIPKGFGFKDHGKIFDTGFLKVSDIHEIYYEASGNPKGKPVFVLHGGPGVGSSPNMRGLFDPKKYMVVLFDQRGAGKSRPAFELKENTTPDIVEDIEKLRNHLGLGKIMIVGGSWGSTLGIAYAEKYPQNVSGMVLRAIYLGTLEEEDITYNRGGLDRYFPEVFEKIVKEVDPGSKELNKKKLMKLLTSPDSAVAEKFSKLWAWYEIKITNLNAPDEAIYKMLGKSSDAGRGLALIETHYVNNGWFLGKNQLMNNAEKLKGIPIALINGRYDMMTPPITAYRLHKKLPDSKLYIVEEAGHTDWEIPIAKKMLEAIQEFE